MLSAPPRFSIRAIELFERPVVLRLPFRFGVVTLTACPQAFVRVRIRGEDGREHQGAAAEMMAPKWFDKNPLLSNEDNFDQLRRVLSLAREAYLSDAQAATAFAHFARHHDPHRVRAQAMGCNPLLAAYGPALIDRALLDALCRAHGCSFYQAMQHNLAGIDAGVRPEFAALDVPACLGARRPQATIHARHTVGLVDAILRTDVAEPVSDGLPESLEEVVARHGHRYFKLKVGGDVDSDLDRLCRIAGVLDRIDEAYVISLDGNEQYQDAPGVASLLAGMRAEPRLQRLLSSILFIEQPLARAQALHVDFRRELLGLPVIIDESDGTLDAFERARACGYAGVSSKACKGVYKSMLNAMRCESWNQQEGAARYFMSAEDLTTQAGLGVQQDLALVNWLGIRHVERNGHHYVNGMAALPDAEQGEFLSAHADLYERTDGAVRLRIRAGVLSIGSLACTGFASAAMPDFDAMQPIQIPHKEIIQ